MATKVSVYSLSDLKSTLDDHLPLYLTSPNLPPTSVPLAKPFRFTQSHFHATVRLALGYAAVGVALYIFYLDYYLKLPWLEHKVVTFWSVLMYSVLNGGLILWTSGWERGLVFEGSRAGSKGSVAARGLQLKIRSLPPHRKYEPVYRMVVEWTAAGTGQQEKRELTVPFTMFFQADGSFVSGEFERWLKRKLPEVLGAGEAALEAVEVEDGDVIVVDSDNKTRTTSTGAEERLVSGAASAKKRSKTKS